MSNDECPFVSVIMPVRNESDFIVRSLGAVLAQDYPEDRMEIVIADGMSDDNTREIISRIANGSSFSVQLIDNPGVIASCGLNRAIEETQGDVIVRVDGHCEVATDYVRRCVYHLRERKEVAGVGGPLDTVAETPMGQAIAAATSSWFGAGGSAFRTVKDKTMLVDTVAFPAYRREAMELAGKFDEELVRNQDDEYNYRLRKLGGKILLAEDVHATYYSRETLRQLWRQYFQYGMYKVRVMQKHPRQMETRQFIPPLFVAALLAGGVLAMFIPIIRWLWVTMVGFYLLANIAALLASTRHTRQHIVLLMPVVFVTLHISYGLGFCVGMVRFVDRWGNNR